MNVITRLATKLLATFSVVALMANPMQALDASDMSFAFGAKAAAPAGQQIELASARGMTATEMQETEGAVAPVVIFVYVVRVGGKIIYTGITNDMKRREGEHLRDKGFQKLEQIAKFDSRNAARVIEQNTINRNNLIANGQNQRNSISPRNPLSRQVSTPYPRRR